MKHSAVDLPLAARRRARSRAHGLAIDHGHLLARAQIGDGRRAFGGRHPKGDAAAGAAAIEAEHQAGPLRRAAMDEGIDAERAVQRRSAVPARARRIRKPGRHISEP